ncbi:hypothetical protein SOASR030_35400 [Leminorella grimontii]|uniref:HicB-like antitoxin of toxin-antitoxin system domain-containing protein n=1 Tax=Leminorella grimontii TaxID=82981 RepID=A0AAV5N941_9GAMM|nr:hypothetical protein [Leminorella grimontii]KFC94407.1 hypothetical protein GLGR_2754 [Leminorella grimontii ATCC 33999 = DSM 5078]GKX57428.1 hypothetical protein SOASR030_35400 [Leminorella grimontii]VFS54621.1 Uncharacterised protein [Leminorella grimontii]
MWHKLKVDNVSGIDKTVGEFTVWMVGILPYAKMKIKIHEDQNGFYSGVTDVAIKRKYDGYPEWAGGSGKTIEEALENTIKAFNEMLKEDCISILTEEDIEYAEWSDF